ncbi:acyltransferase [Shewanella gaetbuli]|uniref:Acyltransferase family protein n=1 Tax=Shewanella gaetbuli TaxID=220752 RepID=A0A9X2CJV8_9GAMM|nr:acyltransferase family protein [Shewanella gaetbuli]MCL1142456.1 acyltransferase family protein [Shewanella gaetbuli]
MRQRVLFFDLLRCVAAVAVIAIHVLAPYRTELGIIPMDEWLTAIGINSASRWAVPVFIMITGALMLSDNRPFDFSYYVKRRLGKVLIPFLVWSVFYAVLAGFTLSGFNGQHVIEVLQNSPNEATYYHLGFFYYFIPLYFVIPLFQMVIKHYGDKYLTPFVLVWLVTSLLNLLSIKGIWSNDLWLYSGYLPLGYLLYQKVPLNKAAVSLFTLMGIAAILTTFYMVASDSMAQGEYSVGKWLSYKTLNVILAASMIFMLCRYVGEGLSASTNKIVGFISTYSLGIYILHPIFLWPMKEFGWHQGHPAWVIPLWIVISGVCALMLSWLFARSEKTKWLLP